MIRCGSQKISNICDQTSVLDGRMQPAECPTIRIRAPLRHAVASAEVRFTKRCTCDCTEIPKTRQIGKSSGAMLTGVTCFGFCYELQNFRMGVAVWERNFRSKSLFVGGQSCGVIGGWEKHTQV